MTGAWKVFLATIGLLIAYTATLKFEWLPRPTDAQQSALELLRKQDSLGTKNGYAAAERLGANPRLEQIQNDPRACALTQDCLAKVQANVRATQDYLNSAEAAFAADAELITFDHFSTMPTPGPTDSYLAYRSNAMLTSIAYQASNGDAIGAQTRACASVAAGRMRLRTDSLLVRMLADAQIRHSLKLLTQIERVYRIPASEACQRAFAALDAPQSGFCPLMRAEFADVSSLATSLDQGREEDPWWAKLGYQLSVNQRHFVAKQAQIYAAFCQATVPAPAQIESILRCSWMERAFNPIGCDLLNVATPNFSHFAQRNAELSQLIKLYPLRQFAASPDAQSCIDDLSCAPTSMRIVGLLHDPKLRKLSVPLLAPRAGDETSFSVVY